MKSKTVEVGFEFGLMKFSGEEMETKASDFQKKFQNGVLTVNYGWWMPGWVVIGLGSRTFWALLSELMARPISIKAQNAAHHQGEFFLFVFFPFFGKDVKEKFI